MDADTRRRLNISRSRGTFSKTQVFGYQVLIKNFNSISDQMADSTLFSPLSKGSDIVLSPIQFLLDIELSAHL